MTPRTLLSSAVGGLILMGCAYPLPRITSTDDCESQHCEVAVAANQHDQPTFACFVDRVTPYELIVRHPRPVNVTFRLDSGSAQNGYSFEANGVVFDEPGGWNCAPVAPQAKLAVCTNAAAAGRHKYTVYVRNGATACEAYDPFVVNQ